MLFRSTGLGKTELKGHVDDVQRSGDYLVMYVDVIDPVKWRIRVCFSFSDLISIVGCFAKGSIIRFILSAKQWRNKTPSHPGEF
jgi:hypothetical protein